MKKVDFIIVGQGIAGTVLSLELVEQGKNVLVIDKPTLSNCSKASGGIYNPVVFKRLTKSWMAETVLPAMHEFYARVEKQLGLSLMHPVHLIRMLANPDEQDLWKKKAANELSDFLEKDIATERLPFADNALGIVKEAGYLDMQAFLPAARRFFVARNAFLEEKFDHQKLQLTEKDMVYKDVVADRLIFCEGPLYKNNPWFKFLQFKPVKGEILTIHCARLSLSSILTKDLFILPLAKPGHFKVGATYNWDDLTDQPTPAGREMLEEKLKKTMPYPYEVIDQQAGVRPSTIDRRPVIGFHPVHKNLGIFNGFGTKGVMLAPYFAKQFCNFIANRSPLPKEVDPARFFNCSEKN